MEVYDIGLLFSRTAAIGIKILPYSEKGSLFSSTYRMYEIEIKSLGI